MIEFLRTLFVCVEISTSKMRTYAHSRKRSGSWIKRTKQGTLILRKCCGVAVETNQPTKHTFVDYYFTLKPHRKKQSCFATALFSASEVKEKLRSWFIPFSFSDFACLDTSVIVAFTVLFVCTVCCICSAVQEMLLYNGWIFERVRQSKTTLSAGWATDLARTTVRTVWNWLWI